MFDRATRMKLRFDTTKGKISTEDLWDLPLTSRDSFNLDAIAVALSTALESKSTSFIKPVSNTNTKLNLQFDIVRHIIAVKLYDLDAAEKRTQNKARKQELLSAVQELDAKALKTRSREDLMKEINSL